MLLIGSSAFAIENTKVSGDAKFYYGTQDSDASGAPDMFNEDASYANFAARLDLTTDLTKGVSAGVGMQVVTTLGIEHNLMSNTWSSAHTTDDSRGSSYGNEESIDSAMWVDEAWLAGSAFDTTMKIGRQALETPLAFSETWGVDKNTFEAVVLINQSLPDTTLIATYIGKSNGSADNQGTDNITGAAAGYVGANGDFETFGSDGTYAYGIVNNSVEPLVLQAWYYDMQSLAKAYWLQADLKVGGLMLGAQFANTDADSLGDLAAYLSPAVIAGLPGSITDVDDTTMFSAMVGYEFKDVMTVKAAVSSVSDDGTLGMGNTATGAAATIGGQSRMYTENWWNYGNVSAVGSDSYSLTAEGTVGDDITLFAGFYYADIDPDSSSNAVASLEEKEFTQFTVTASKSFGPLDTSLAVIFADADYDESTTTNTDVTTTDIQLYLTYNF